MRQIGRSALVALLAIAATVLMVFTSTMTAVVTLTATALYMGGTRHPLSIPQDTPEYIQSYVENADFYYVGPSKLCGAAPCSSQVAVYTPAQFWPITGLDSITFDKSVALGVANLDNCIRGAACTVTLPPFTETKPPQEVTDTSYVVFGYSQSAAVASIEKGDLIAKPPYATTGFVLVANPNRPNGGILERFVGLYIPIIDVTFNGATPTDSPRDKPLTTVDVAGQYDPVSDFPTNPLNLLADLNALAGFIYVHPEENYFDADTPLLQGQYQDTTYYLIPTPTLPLLMPLELIPVIGPPLAVTLDPPMRVLVETGYDRTINPGAPTPAKWLYFPCPVETAINLAVAIPTGWDNGIAYITGNPADRPFHTTPPGPYGVGGPPVDTGSFDEYGDPTPATTTMVAEVTSVATETAESAVESPKPKPIKIGHSATPLRERAGALMADLADVGIPPVTKPKSTLVDRLSTRRDAREWGIRRDGFPTRHATRSEPTTDGLSPASNEANDAA